MTIEVPHLPTARGMRWLSPGGFLSSDVRPIVQDRTGATFRPTANLLRSAPPPHEPHFREATPDTSTDACGGPIGGHLSDIVDFLALAATSIDPALWIACIPCRTWKKGASLSPAGAFFHHCRRRPPTQGHRTFACSRLGSDAVNATRAGAQ